jgi:protein-tyrosine phosphatase
LKENNITHVVSIIDRKLSTAAIVYNNIIHLHISLSDDENEPIGKYFQECVVFIKTALESSGAVYVHCFAGISRSPTIVAAYLITSMRISAKDALEIIRKERPVGMGVGLKENSRLKILRSRIFKFL